MVDSGVEMTHVTYSALIAAHVRGGEWQQAFVIYDAMIKKRLPPNEVCVCCKCGARRMVQTNWGLRLLDMQRLADLGSWVRCLLLFHVRLTLEWMWGLIFSSFGNSALNSFGVAVTSH